MVRILRIAIRGEDISSAFIVTAFAFDLEMDLHRIFNRKLLDLGKIRKKIQEVPDERNRNPDQKSKKPKKKKKTCQEPKDKTKKKKEN